MVGASVIQMENALAVMLGSNLGTTLNSWIVATVGFNFNIESYILPVAGITGICMAFSNSETKWFSWFRFIFGLAFLFVALGFIKTGMEGFVKQTDLSAFSQYPLIVFLLLGILLTTVVQSSSATVALTLSALYTNAITLYIATAIVLGAEIGTTFKLFLASAKGTADKKRVALGNFLFNIITVTVMFALLRPVNYFITGIVQVNDNLIALVFFQSLVNLVCIFLFFPFLNLFGKFLLKRFTNKEDESFYISKVPVSDTAIALDALDHETRHFIQLVINYSLDSFYQEDNTKEGYTEHKSFYHKTVPEKYEYIKQLHGEMHVFYLKLQKIASQKGETERLEQLIFAIRNTMYAAKNIRDAQHDITQMRNSSNDTKYNFYKQSGEKIRAFSAQVLNMLNTENGSGHFAKLVSLYQSVTGGYSDTLQSFYKGTVPDHVSEIEISTLINFNRQLYTSFKSFLFALKDYLLTAKEADYFDSQPGFIR
jgi:phosphate:Na+ symporter